MTDIREAHFKVQTSEHKAANLSRTDVTSYYSNQQKHFLEEFLKLIVIHCSQHGATGIVFLEKKVGAKEVREKPLLCFTDQPWNLVVATATGHAASRTSSAILGMLELLQ